MISLVSPSIRATSPASRSVTAKMLSRLYLFCCSGRPFGHRHDHVPARLDLGHAELRRLRRLVLDEARHDVHFLLRQLARLAPARHAGRRTLVDEHLQVLGALLLGDVGGERLAGGALAQHAVAAGAALEVDLLRVLELGLRHVRGAGRHEDLDAFRAGRRRRALVLELGRGRRVLGRRGGRLGLCGRLGAHGCDLCDRHCAALVAPRVHRVGQRVGDLLVRQLRHRRHHGVVLDPVHHDFALEAAHDHADRAILVAEQVVGAGQRRESAGQALAVGLVAGQAGRLVDGLRRPASAPATPRRRPPRPCALVVRRAAEGSAAQEGQRVHAPAATSVGADERSVELDVMDGSRGWNGPATQGRRRGWGQP